MMAAPVEEQRFNEVELYQRLKKYDNARFTYRGMEGTKLGTYRKSAVLVPLFLRDGIPHMLLTKRSLNLRTHKGDVAFPGGMKDESDENEIDTALREADEEIGLRSDQVKIISRFPPRVNRNRTSIYPVLGLIPADFVPKPNPDEVESVFTIRLSRFLEDDENHESHSFPISNSPILGMYHVFDDVINGKEYRTWGLTANIIIELAVLVAQKVPDFEYDPNCSISVEDPFAAQLNYLKLSHHIPSNKL